MAWNVQIDIAARAAVEAAKDKIRNGTSILGVAGTLPDAEVLMGYPGAASGSVTDFFGGFEFQVIDYDLTLTRCAFTDLLLYLDDSSSDLSEGFSVETTNTTIKNLELYVSAYTYSLTMDLDNCGIEKCTLNASEWYQSCSLDLSGNAIPTAGTGGIDNIVDNVYNDVYSSNSITEGLLHLAGGTNGEPSEAQKTKLETMNTAGWDINYVGQP